MSQRNLLGDPMLDRVMLVVTNLAEELYVTRDRLQAIEGLLDRRGVVTREDVERYEPEPGAREDAKRMRDEFVARLFDVPVGAKPET